MRKFIIVSTLIVTLGQLSHGQNVDLTFGTDINTVGDAFIQISIIPAIDSAVTIADISEGVSFRIMLGNRDLIDKLSTQNKRLRHNRTSILLVLSGLGDDQLDDLLKNLSDAKVVLSSDLTITLSDNSTKIISKESLASDSDGQLVFNNQQKTQYVEASGGEYAFMKNKFKVGYTPSDQSETGKSEYNLDFAYRKAYRLFNNKNAYFTTSGLVSTNAVDSVNYLKVYPVSYKFTNTERLSETVVEAGVEGDQTFNYWRYSVNLEYRLIIGNLINLSEGAGRLRLKPVVSAGLKIYSEQESNPTIVNGNLEKSGQLFGNFYYVIPVFESFTIVADLGAFYDANEKVNPKQKLKYNYDISFGYELKGESFQTLLTYKNGVNPITNLRDDLISIGLLAQLGGSK